MRLAVFDLDGTLTRTTGVDDECFVRAMSEELGVGGFCTDWAEYPHSTDQGLAVSTPAGVGARVLRVTRG